MQKKTKLITKVLIFSSLLFSIFTFSQCQKDGLENLTIGSDTMGMESDVSTTSASVFPVNVSKGISNGGFAVRIPMDPKLASDSNTESTASKVRVFENGLEIGPAHSSHQDIRDFGKGRFSHKSGFLFLSASDNSNPMTNGKKYTYTVGGQSPTIPPVVPPTDEGINPPLSTDEPIGFASVNGKTTGGLGGKTITVTTFSELQNAVSSSAPLIIQVSGTITGSGLLRVASNKTILGLKGSKLIGASLFIYGKNNIIIRNMTISKVKTYSNIIIKAGSHHVWVDHCDLSSELINVGAYDGLLDVGTGADYVTLSWNRIYLNHKAMLIGFSYNEPESVGKLHVTVHNNYFYNVSERTPDVRYGTVHTFNNYYENAKYIGAFMGAIVRVENSYFKNSTLPIRTDLSNVPGVISGEKTNIFENSGKNWITTAPSSWVPNYEYKSVLSAAANVPSLVMKGAGATL